MPLWGFFHKKIRSKQFLSWHKRFGDPFVVILNSDHRSPVFFPHVRNNPPNWYRTTTLRRNFLRIRLLPLPSPWNEWLFPNPLYDRSIWPIESNNQNRTYSLYYPDTSGRLHNCLVPYGHQKVISATLQPHCPYSWIIWPAPMPPWTGVVKCSYGPMPCNSRIFQSQRFQQPFSGLFPPF